MISITQMLGFALLNVVDGSLKITPSLGEVGELHVGIRIAGLFSNNRLEHF